MKKRTTITVTHTGGGGPVRVPTDEAKRDGLSIAEYTAGVIARREYGRRGYYRTLRLDSWTEDGSSHTYEAFIGHDDGHGATVGRNVWIYC